MKRKREKSYFRLMVGIILTVVILSILNKIDFNIFNFKSYFNKEKRGVLILVNRKHKVGKEYIPNDLEKFTVRTAKGACEEERQVSSKIMKPLEKLFDAADKDGITLYALSGYRSYLSQKYLYNSYLAKDGLVAKSTVAQPGESEHQTGLALDLTNSRRNFTGSKEAKWIDKNCYKYGFILRYPKDKTNITGYSYESWHIRYVGDKIAKEIHDKKITLEEYLKEV